jgi:hypothetical protein
MAPCSWNFTPENLLHSSRSLRLQRHNRMQVRACTCGHKPDREHPPRLPRKKKDHHITRGYHSNNSLTCTQSASCQMCVESFPVRAGTGTSFFAPALGAFDAAATSNIHCSRRTRVYTACLADDITGKGQFRIPTLVLFFISEAVVSSLPLVYHGLIRRTFLDFQKASCPFSL